MLGLSFILITLFYFTYVSAERVFVPKWQFPDAVSSDGEQLRIVVITHDLDTPFWEKVGEGALDEAEQSNVELEIWGSLGNNDDDFFRKFEIAIHSKVDGIIVQGLDSEEFYQLAKFKASFYGIPIITIANDVPMTESLRRTYVGSDQYEAGELIARQLVADMGAKGDVILVYDSQVEFYQKERLRGIEAVLGNYEHIQIKHAQTPEKREDVISITQQVLNDQPTADAFIILNAAYVGAMIQEIERRSQLNSYFLYSFDDGPETLNLFEQGKLDGLVEQEPEKMGRKSVQLMLEWIHGETVPLDIEGYFTGINIKKAEVKK